MCLSIAASCSEAGTECIGCPCCMQSEQPFCCHSVCMCPQLAGLSPLGNPMLHLKKVINTS